MNAEHKAWIEKNYPTRAEAWGQCAQACHAMAAAFPELRITNGEIYAILDPEPRLHWWLVDPTGEIVDPTAHQFQGIAEYIEIDDSHPARNFERMKCMNCGEHFYNTPEHSGFSPLCSESCARDYAAYCNNPGGFL